MPRAEAGRQRAVLEQAAGILEARAGDIVASWARRMRAELYPERPDLDLAGLRDEGPRLVRGVSEALRGEARWAEPARRHAATRLAQQVDLDHLTREFRMLRQEMWRALAQHMGDVPAAGVFGLAEAMDGALDAIAAASLGAFGAASRQATERRLEATHGRLEAVLEQMPSGVIIAEAPSGRVQLCNEQASRIWRRPLPVLSSIDEYGQWEGYHHDGRRYRADEWPLSRSIRLGEVVSREEIRIRRGDDTWGWIDASSAPLRSRQGRITGAVMVFADASERKQAEEALREAKEYAETLIENANAMIVGLDVAGRIRVFNPAAEEITGYTRAEVEGKNWFDVLVPRERYPEVWEVFRKAISEGVVPRTFDNPILTKSGAERYLLFRNNVVREDDRVTGTISFGIDITESRRAAAERERLLEELRQVNERLVVATVREQELAAEAERRAADAEAALRLRDEFLNVAAHELKTPLTSLKGYAELTMQRVEQGCLRDPQQLYRALQIMDQQVDRLTGLVSQLLDISRIESGALRLEPQPTDLVALARGTLERMQGTTTRHALSLKAPASLVANVDPLRLDEVLYNLIDNAIRYSPKGGPVEVELSAPDPETVRIAVRDHGIGVPAAQRERLFTRFFQASKRPAGGLGLGLYISRRIVELHGGHIWAEFPEDGGSRFVVTLPAGGAAGGEAR